MREKSTVNDEEERMREKSLERMGRGDLRASESRATGGSVWGGA